MYSILSSILVREIHTICMRVYRKILRYFYAISTLNLIDFMNAISISGKHLFNLIVDFVDQNYAIFTLFLRYFVVEI